jgi:anti-sigma regulatory factor (Ser/Thr protein kinase)
MADSHPRRFEASLERFPDLRDYAERCCAGAGFERNAIDRLVLVLEELFANTVEHGYSRLPGDSAGRGVWLSVAAAMGRIEVTYEDAAPEYDPFTKTAAPDYSGPADSWQIGGLGIALVIRLGRNVRYERRGDRNCIRFTILAAAPGA